MRIVRKLSVRRHLVAGYSFEMQDLNTTMWHVERTKDHVLLYSEDYHKPTPLFKLTVYKEVPGEDPAGI